MQRDYVPYRRGRGILLHIVVRVSLNSTHTRSVRELVPSRARPGIIVSRSVWVRIHVRREMSRALGSVVSSGR